MTDIRIVAMADLHVGNPRIDHHSMYVNLVSTFYPEVIKSHICFIAGDFFDTLLYLGSSPAMYGIRIMRDLLAISDKHGVKIRILNGTFSHDRNQPATIHAMRLETPTHELLGSLPTLGDAKVIDRISPETITGLVADGVLSDASLNVIYIPDSLPYKNGMDVIFQIKDILKLTLWDEKIADLIVGHGTFDFMMPDNVPLPPCTYDIPMFDEVVKGPIVMGHIHTHARRKNVIYTGSFERIAHGEEEDKGFVVLERTDGKWVSKFIRNAGAVLFISIYPEGDNHDAIVRDYMDKVVDKFGTRTGYVRVLHHDAEVRSILAKVTAMKYPQLHYVSKSTATESKLQLRTVAKTDNTSMDMGPQYDVVPTESNLDELIVSYLRDRPHLSSDIKDLTKDDVSMLLKEE